MLKLFSTNITIKNKHVIFIKTSVIIMKAQSQLQSIYASLRLVSLREVRTALPSWPKPRRVRWQSSAHCVTYSAVTYERCPRRLQLQTSKKKKNKQTNTNSFQKQGRAAALCAVSARCSPSDGAIRRPRRRPRRLQLQTSKN